MLVAIRLLRAQIRIEEGRHLPDFRVNTYHRDDDKFPQSTLEDVLMQRAYWWSAREYKKAVKDLRAADQFTQLEAAYLTQRPKNLSNDSTCSRRAV